MSAILGADKSSQIHCHEISAESSHRRLHRPRASETSAHSRLAALPLFGYFLFTANLLSLAASLFPLPSNLVPRPCRSALPFPPRDPRVQSLPFSAKKISQNKPNRAFVCSTRLRKQSQIKPNQTHFFRLTASRDVPGVGGEVRARARRATLVYDGLSFRLLCRRSARPALGE